MRDTEVQAIVYTLVAELYVKQLGKAPPFDKSVEAYVKIYPQPLISE